MYRRLFVLAALALTLAACTTTDASTAPAPTTGTVYWKLDGVTCTGSGSLSVQFFIEGTNVGTESLSVAAPQSKGYTTSAGQHALGARIANTTGAWESVNAAVPAGGSYTVVLPCA